MNKPFILSIIEEHVDLRHAGREYKRLCPFHREKTPSFSVDEEKGVFYCFGCGAKGDLFDFIMQLDGVSFPEARARLGIASTPPRPRAYDPLRDTAAIITDWANNLTINVNAQLRELCIGQDSHD